MVRSRTSHSYASDYLSCHLLMLHAGQLRGYDYGGLDIHIGVILLCSYGALNLSYQVRE